MIKSFKLKSSVDNAHVWEPSSHQPGWLEQMQSCSILIYSNIF